MDRFDTKTENSSSTGGGNACEGEPGPNSAPTRSIATAAASFLQRSFGKIVGCGSPLLKFNVKNFRHWAAMSKPERRNVVRLVGLGVAEGVQAHKSGAVLSSLPIFRSYVSSPGAIIRCILGPWQDHNVIVNVYVKATKIVVSVVLGRGAGDDSTPRPPAMRSAQLVNTLRLAVEEMLIAPVWRLFPKGTGNVRQAQLGYSEERALSEVVARSTPNLRSLLRAGAGRVAECGRACDGWFERELGNYSWVVKEVSPTTRSATDQLWDRGYESMQIEALWHAPDTAAMVRKVWENLPATKSGDKREDPTVRLADRGDRAAGPTTLH